MYIPVEELKDVLDVKYDENSGYVLARKAMHKAVNPTIICNRGIEKVDGVSWELFKVHYEAPDRYYGMPMEGLGLVNCMIMKSDTRPFTENELKHYTDDVKLSMVGAISGETSYQFKLRIKPHVDFIKGK